MNYSRRTWREEHAAFSVAARMKWIIIKYVEHISSICNEGAGKSTGVLSDRAQTTCTGTIAIQHQQSHLYVETGTSQAATVQLDLTALRFKAVTANSAAHL